MRGSTVLCPVLCPEYGESTMRGSTVLYPEYLQYEKFYCIAYMQGDSEGVREGGTEEEREEEEEGSELESDEEERERRKKRTR